MKYLYKDSDDICWNNARIVSDPNLIPEERETHIYFYDNDDYAYIDSSQPAWIKHLISHNEFICDPKGVVTTMDDNGNEIVVGIKGKLPKNCIRTSSKPRQRFDKL